MSSISIPPPLRSQNRPIKKEIDLGVADARLDTVNGQVAIVTEPDTDYYKSNPADVRFVLGSVEMNLFSHELTTKDLLSIANSLAPTTPITTASPTVAR